MLGVCQLELWVVYFRCMSFNMNIFWIKIVSKVLTLVPRQIVWHRYEQKFHIKPESYCNEFYNQGDGGADSAPREIFWHRYLRKFHINPEIYCKEFYNQGDGGADSALNLDCTLGTLSRNTSIGPSNPCHDMDIEVANLWCISWVYPNGHHIRYWN